MTGEGHSNTHPGPQDSIEASPEIETTPPWLRADYERGRAPDGHNSPNISAPAGATVYPPAVTPSAATNPRSCVTCRRRKVRCDKYMPCGNCRRAQILCVFPAPGRAPRRPRPKDPNAPQKQHSSEREIELVKRLRKLEGIVEELSCQIELEAVRHSSTDGHSPDAASGDGDHRHMSTPTDASRGSGSRGNATPAAGSRSRAEGSGTVTQNGSPHDIGGLVNLVGGLVTSPTEMNKSFGRLVLNKGTSRYVSSGFWSKINDELNELRGATADLAGEGSDDSDDESNAQSVEEVSLDHQSFIMGYRSADVDLRPLHPLPSQIPFLWQIFQENVDPVLKILHIPTMERAMRERRANLGDLSPSTEALMFSIYYAAVISMEAEDVATSLGTDKASLLSQYRFAVEQALAKAGFITDPDLTVCQALVMYLVLVRRHEKARFSWTLTGLAVRICQAIGIHRDGTNFPHLKPFEVEMRRRLFWSLLMLDLRAAEDQGTECIVTDGSFDTQLPLNIDDADISPDSTELPPARDGLTSMTLCLIRFEICGLARKMHMACNTVPQDLTRDGTMTMLQEREEMLLDAYNQFEAKYLRNSSAEESPAHWVSRNIARTIIAKMITVIYQPILFSLPVDPVSCRLRERLFLAAVEIFEYYHLLNTDPRCKQWRWLFRTYTQWHAMAYLLLELCNREWSATSERAWAAISACFSGPYSLAIEETSGRTAIWLPFRKLCHRAKKHRDAELARLRSDPATAERIDRLNRTGEAPSSFGALSDSIKSSIAQERWRKLVNLAVAPGPPLPSAAADSYQQQRQQQQQPHEPVSARVGAQGGDVNMSSYPSALPPNHVDEIVGAAIADPQFRFTSIMPLVFPDRPDAGGGNPMMAARGMVSGGFPSVNMPTAATGNSNNNNTSSSSSSNPAASSSAAPAPCTPGRDDGSNPLAPVWLWNDGLEMHHGASDVRPLEEDAYMDEALEGPDWQNWEQYVRGFELETNGVAAIPWFGGVYDM